MTDKATSYQQVKEFHEAFGAPVGTEPHFVLGDRLDLRLALIDEELGEVIEAIKNDDLENFAKELADLVYVVNGLAVEAGIDLDKVGTAVHESNMSKLDDDGKPILREDGKILKSKNYKEPDIASLLS